MSEPTNPTFQIPRDVIEPIIKAHVSTAITQALGGHGAIMNEAIRSVLFTKVDSDGRASNYTHSTSPTRLDWLVSQAITEAVREEIVTAIAKHRDVIKKNIADTLSKRNSPILKQLAESMIGAIANADTLKWRLKVECDAK